MGGSETKEPKESKEQSIEEIESDVQAEIEAEFAPDLGTKETEKV